jgi:hypothetical protein
VSKWKRDIDSKVMLSDGRPIPVVLLANKVGDDTKMDREQRTRKSRRGSDKKQRQTKAYGDRIRTAVLNSSLLPLLTE